MWRETRRTNNVTVVLTDHYLSCINSHCSIGRHGHRNQTLKNDQGPPFFCMAIDLMALTRRRERETHSG